MDNLEITRIDFFEVKDGYVVTKFCRVPERNSSLSAAWIPREREVKPDFDLDAALSWCERNGWTVRRWPGGCRAFKHGPEPVRSRSAIMRMREDVRRGRIAYEGGVGVSLDFAYDG